MFLKRRMHPNDLMDPAFQRRISYKLETLEPPEDLYKKVFKMMAVKQGLELPESIYQQVIDSIRAVEAPLAYFQPKFIVEQVLASCKFEGIKPQFTPQNTEDALSNLFIQSTKSKNMRLKLMLMRSSGLRLTGTEWTSQAGNITM